MEKHLNFLRTNRKGLLNGYIGLEGGTDIARGLEKVNIMGSCRTHGRLPIGASI